MTQSAKDVAIMPSPWARSPGRARDTQFEAAFRSYYEGVYRLLFRLVGSRDEAEDLAQEAFLRLYRQDFAAERRHNTRAWLYRVATNLAHNARRGNLRRVGREDRAESQGLVATAPDPAEAALRQSERESVRRALARLPERQARLLLLRHSGLSYKELAEVEGIAPTSVGTLLARAEAAFAAAYAGDEAPREVRSSDGL